MSYRMTRPIPFGSRNLPYDFRAPRRAQRALAGLGRLRRGLGEVCNQATVEGQFACSERNTQAMIDAACAKEGPGGPDCGVNWVQYLQNPDQFPNAEHNTYSTAPAAAAPSSPSYAPRLSFVTSRGGSTVYPGDTWTVAITGAAPNQQVSVLGTHPDGGSATQSFGKTDGSGNFSLAGTITADMLGSWSEIWSVGGQQVGSFGFVVAQPSQQTAGAASSPGGPAANGGSTGGASLPAFSFSSIPWWGWAVAGVGGLMLMGGGHGR